MTRNDLFIIWISLDVTSLLMPVLIYLLRLIAINQYQLPMHRILVITLICIGFEIQDSWAMVPIIPYPSGPVQNPNPMTSSMWVQPPFCQLGPHRPNYGKCLAYVPSFTYNATEGTYFGSIVYWIENEWNFQFSANLFRRQKGKKNLDIRGKGDQK